MKDSLRRGIVAHRVAAVKENGNAVADEIKHPDHARLVHLKALKFGVQLNALEAARL